MPYRFTNSNTEFEVKKIFFFFLVTPENDKILFRFLSAGQNNGFNDLVLKSWMEMGNARSLIALDLDSSDNLTDEALNKFLLRHGPQLNACVLSGMPHITDQLWMGVLPILTNAK